MPDDVLEQQVLRISLARLVGLAAEMKLRHGRCTVSSPDGGERSPLVPIRAVRRASAVPLVLIHPVGGSILAYHALAEHLRDSQPVYAIENQIAFRPGVALRTTIEGMAEHYLAEVTALHPTGPLMFGGYSMGGATAFEMARQAAARGRDVRAVIVIDTPARLRALPDQPEGATSVRVLSTVARMLAARGSREVNLGTAELDHLDPERRIEYFLSALKREGLLPPQVQAPLLMKLLEVVRNNEIAQRGYVPGRYDGELLLLRASAPSPELRNEAPEVYDDPSFGWQAACSRPVILETVPGDHMRLLNPPGVRILGEALQRYLDRKAVVVDVPF